MTTPEFPGAGSQQLPPSLPQQPPLEPPTDSAPATTSPTLPAKAKKRLNVLGLIALITAGLGFIFACVPGALILGWILLPIGFILALVSLFLKGVAKWMSVTALILSIVGTIVGVIVFLAVVATSIDDALGGGGSTVVEPAATEVADNAVAEPATAAGTRTSPYPIGSIIESDDWRVVINSVTLGATDVVVSANQFNETPTDGSEYVLINYSATYIGADANGQIPAFVSIEYVTAAGTTVNELDKLVVAPEPIDTMSTLYTGGTATGNTAIEVPTASAGQGVLAIRPGMLGDKIFVAVQ